MKKVIEIHGYKVVEVDPGTQEGDEVKVPFPDARDQHLINKNFNKATGGK